MTDRWRNADVEPPPIGADVELFRYAIFGGSTYPLCYLTRTTQYGTFDLRRDTWHLADELMPDPPPDTGQRAYWWRPSTEYVLGGDGRFVRVPTITSRKPEIRQS